MKVICSCGKVYTLSPTSVPATGGRFKCRSCSGMISVPPQKTTEVPSAPNSVVTPGWTSEAKPTADTIPLVIPVPTQARVASLPNGEHSTDCPQPAFQHCTFCGTRNSDWDKYCSSCGQALIPLQNPVCRSCNKENLPDMKFCEECGAELSP
jgi:hypothetical protein